MLAGYVKRAMKIDSSTLPHAFLEAADEFPRATAIIDGPEWVSYRDLARAAEAVRRDLGACGIGPGEFVGISMRRSWHLVAAIIGTLAAGAFYVPLDPGYPRSRLDFMADDSGPRVVCADPESVAVPGAKRIPVTGELADTAVEPVAADSSGYLIYTSGSTGRPKGVVIPQRHVLELFTGAAKSVLQFTPEDVWTLCHSYSFDFSVWEMWGALLSGAALVIVDDEATRDPSRLLDLMQANRVSVLSQVPSQFKYLALCYELDPRPLESLRYVIFGGEAVDKPSVRKWLSLRGGHEQLINMYGITETTVHATAAVLGDADVADDSTPCTIGAPLPHLDVALVRADGSPSAIGEPGEIWVTGSTLSPGYLDRPELTADRFVHRDLGSGTCRWYRSGDLALRSNAGTLFYLGRIDSQVKLRGFRIELGEVEAILRDIDGVLDAAAALAVLPGDERTLVAVVVLSGTAPAVSARELREACCRRLPAYMVPDRVAVAPRIPTTPGGGKTDRNAVAEIATR
jgi:amino acid adenylation domain-containing protein